MKPTNEDIPLPPRNMMIVTWKTGFIVVLIAWVITLLTFAFYIYKTKKQNPIIIQQPSTTQQTSTQNQTIGEECIAGGPLSINQFLDEYVVQEGDTLLSIAKKQLGDSSRSTEIIALNNHLGRYPELSISKPFIEVGWKLYMPPKNVSQTGGNIQAYAGKITDIADDRFLISFKDGGGGRVALNPSTQFIQKAKEEYEIGDCILHIEDVRSSGVRVLYILPLSQFTLSNFKTLTK